MRTTSRTSWLLKTATSDMTPALYANAYGLVGSILTLPNELLFTPSKLINALTDGAKPTTVLRIGLRSLSAKTLNIVPRLTADDHLVERIINKEINDKYSAIIFNTFVVFADVYFTYSTMMLSKEVLDHNFDSSTTPICSIASLALLNLSNIWSTTNTASRVYKFTRNIFYN